ncbi:hypothetical protein HYPSUDRAFT_194879 [Hypholoma sublateritium FD-334 SS-4]|uniref:Uncharacterized protein n=1 Tax=Hypholoma sublateritium (strain FD-334 SS-4) TaxID=945553 RepID=A0A0D2NDN6_HYPSF|nr:hypothetical protein HYPSUDRAFT_194879 [Hypholoma sublateritium FD-334 SS-4]
MDSILQKTGKKLFEKHLEKYAPEDPLYEFYTDDKGREKRRKRDLPPGLSKRDARILRSVKRRAHYLDKGISLCGLRVGWTFFIGLIPLAGDVADALLNYLLVVRPARRADIPGWLLRRMLLNNAVSAGVGTIPIAGDVALAMFKANSRNAALLEEFLRIRGAEFIKAAGADAVHPEDASGRGWFGGGGKKKGKSAGAAPLPAADLEQVKPGAGMSGDEMQRALPSGSKKKTAQANIEVAPTAGEASKKGSPQSGASFGFFGRKKSTATKSTTKGRFVENVDSEA